MKIKESCKLPTAEQGFLYCPYAYRWAVEKFFERVVVFHKMDL